MFFFGWNFVEFQKNLGMFWNLIQKQQKTQGLGFFRFSTYQNSKKTSSFQKFQNPKTFKPDVFFVFLEFCRTPKKPKDFLEFDPKTAKTQGFFGICFEIPKKHGFFQGFPPNSTKFQKKKNHWVFKNFKTRFVSPTIFGILEFWKTRVVFGILTEFVKKTGGITFSFDWHMPKSRKTPKTQCFFFIVFIYIYIYKKKC